MLQQTMTMTLVFLSFYLRRWRLRQLRMYGRPWTVYRQSSWGLWKSCRSLKKVFSCWRSTNNQKDVNNNIVTRARLACDTHDRDVRRGMYTVTDGSKCETTNAETNDLRVRGASDGIEGNNVSWPRTDDDNGETTHASRRRIVVGHRTAATKWCRRIRRRRDSVFWTIFVAFQSFPDRPPTKPSHR